MSKVTFAWNFKNEQDLTGRVEDGDILCTEVGVLCKESAVQLKRGVVMDLESGKTGLSAGSAI